MRKTILLLLLLFVGSQTISAQVPGYQGKRFSAGYNASTFFYIIPEGWNGDISDIFAGTRLSYKTELHVNYVLSRKVSAGFSYYFAKQKAYFTHNYVENFGYLVPKDDYALCRLNIFEFNMKFFRKNFIAPAGFYHQLSVAMVLYSLGEKGNTLTTYNQNNSSAPVVIEGDKDPYSCVKLGYSIGKTNPIGHNFYLNTAIGVNFFRGGDSYFLRDASEVHVRNYILVNFNRNLRTHNLIELKLGFGWLAF